MADKWAGESHGWRYLAVRMDGSGGMGDILDNELPIHDVDLTRQLTGPHQGSATISPELARLLGLDDLPILDEWRCGIYAEADGVIRHGGILVHSAFQGPEWGLEWSGFSGYPTGMAWEGDPYNGSNVDPLDVYRMIWANIQAGQDSDLGLVIDDATCPVRIGLPEPDPSTPDPSTGQPVMQAKPYALNEWETTDLGQKADDLATATPFDYREHHLWTGDDRTEIGHFLELGYPSLGQRRPGRFVLDENVQIVPEADRAGDDYANHVRVMGAGEGSQMVRQDARVRDGRLRRMKTVDRKDLTDADAARLAARQELQARLVLTSISQLVIRDHPNAKLGTFVEGDEIRFQGETDWIGDVDFWVRILALTMRPEDPSLISATVVRSDAMGTP